MGLIVAGGQVAVLGRLHGHSAGDKHLSGQHGIPLLNCRIPLLRLDVGDNAICFGYDVKISFLVYPLRGGDRLPHDDLQAGTVEVDPHPGQLLHFPQGLLSQLLPVQAGAIDAGPDAQLSQLA